jgi:hypothetical protein
MPQPDEITLILPRDREFHRVAHLVLGGLALRLNLTIETLEDLQLALSAILDHAKPNGDVTVSLVVNDGTLETSVGPVDVAEALSNDGDGLSLRRILWTVADDVKLDGDYVRLTKKVPLDGHHG